MKLKLFVPMLLSLIAAPAFAHISHDDDGTLPPLEQEVQKDAQVAPKATPEEKPPAKK